MKAPGDWKKPNRHTGAYTACENYLGTHEIGKGVCTKMSKKTRFYSSYGSSERSMEAPQKFHCCKQALTLALPLFRLP